jgi:ABC transport permease subunit
MTPNQAPQLEQDPQDPGVIRLSGQWTLRTALDAAEVLRAAPEKVTGIDASGITQLDSAGVLQVLRVAHRADLPEDALTFREEHRALVCTIEAVADDRPKAQRDCGAEIYVVELVSIAFLREFAVLLTAIVLAGRTASAFTAQIGSMKAREEIDAIRTLGLDPVDLLVLPRIIALLVTLPLLTFVAMIAGLAGGVTVGAFDLDIPPQMYLARLHDTIEVRHMLVGLSKAPIFAAVIGLIGCLEGLKVEGTAQSVGERTTSSVVQTISLVIIIDAFAALWFMHMDW